MTGNRPYKYGASDRREFIVQDSEVSLVAINNTSGSPVYLGRAKVGVALDEDKWQIRKITYDANGGATRVEWPETSSYASNEYIFEWSRYPKLTITNISQSATAVVTVAAIGLLQNGNKVVIQNVEGMDEVNGGENVYTVANIAGNTFELQGINSTAFTAYTGGGDVTYGNVLELTYS